MYHEQRILGIALVPDGSILRIVNAAGSRLFRENRCQRFCALPPGIFLHYAESDFPYASKSDSEKLNSESNSARKVQRKLERQLARAALRFRLEVPQILNSLPFQLDFSEPVRVGDSWLLKPDNVQEELLAEIGQEILKTTGVSASACELTEVWPKFGFFLGCGVTKPAVDAFSFRKLSAILYAIEPWDECMTGARWKILASARRLVGKPAQKARAFRQKHPK